MRQSTTQNKQRSWKRRILCTVKARPTSLLQFATSTSTYKSADLNKLISLTLPLQNHIILPQFLPHQKKKHNQNRLDFIRPFCDGFSARSEQSNTRSGCWQRICEKPENNIYTQMCVDDYQFRHFSATRDKVCHEDDFAKTYYVNISQFEEFGDVGICKILIYLSTKGLTVKNRKFYLPRFSAIIEAHTFCRIMFEALDQKEIILKSYSSEKPSEDIFTENETIEEQCQNEPGQQQNYYCRFQEIENIEDMYELLSPEQEPVTMPEVGKQEETVEERNSAEEKMIDQNEQKSNDRSDESHKKKQETGRRIAEVIQAVKVWRKLYQSKKCNLTQAAHIVGLSKKSLDDYYLVLRVGEILGFNYTSNLEGKMGDLRNFIRSQQQKVTGKLGKNVQCFRLVQDINIDRLLEQFNQRESKDK